MLGVVIAVVLLCQGIQSLAAAGDDKMVTLSADVTRWYPDDRVTAEGNVQAAYRNYKVTADLAEADLRTNTAVFRGGVKLSTAQHTVEGDELTLDLKTKDWKLDKATSRSTLEAVQGDPSSMVFLHSESLSGRDEDLKLEQGRLTTCDLDHPHYYLSAREVEIYPDSKIIARGVSFVGWDKKLLTLKSLVIPIRGFRHNLIPQIGSSAEEGTFIKAAYSYMATEAAHGILKLDLMQKRGIGTGLDHSYKLSTGSGNASVYYLADQEIGGSNITGRLQHQQKLGAIDLNVTGDYRTNSYMYYPTTTTQNYQVGLRHNSIKSNTALTLRSSATSGIGKYDTFTSSLRHNQQFNSKLSGVLSMDMRRYLSSGMTAADRDLESVLELRQRDDKYDLSLVASKRIDLDGDDYTGDSFYSYLDRLPELTFETDSYRMGSLMFLGLPSRLLVSAGKYHEAPSGVKKDRLLLQWDMLGQRLDLGDKSDVNLTAGFRQAFYANDMAQHVLKFGGAMTTRYNDYLRTRLTYNYQQPQGYSPFLFDYTGKHNYLRAVMDYQDSQKLRWSLSTGYDFNRDTYPWQDVALRLTARPNANYAFSVSTGYDINRSRWRSLINRFQINIPDRVSLDLGTRYDIERGKLDLARGRLDYRINDKWRIEGISSWNGVSKKFDFNSFRLTRDLHCWEASLTYNDETGFRRDKGLMFEMRIKAFPGVDRFGFGQYGQAVDPGMGQYYY